MGKTVLSGIKPSGIPQLGNYVGAISYWAELQNKYDHAIFPVVDLHAITVPQDPKVLSHQTYLTTAIILASGINPKKSIVFVQSDVPAHSELMWLLTTVATMGELGRMTQYKDKSGTAQLDSVEKALSEELREAYKIAHAQIDTNTSNVDDMAAALVKIQAQLKAKSDLPKLQRYMLLLKLLEERRRDRMGAGLFTYPVLMAADILLYQANVVPVGEDQKQHVELARDLAERFNKRFGETFVVPEPLLRKEGARIMDLLDPAKKMSKSDNDNGCILLTDSPEIIRKKIMRAETDSGHDIKFNPVIDREGVHNLLTIYKVLSGKTEAQIEKHFAKSGYGDLKRELSELVIAKLSPIQKQIDKYMKNKKLLERILNDGAQRADKIAQKTLAEAKKKIGLIT